MTLDIDGPEFLADPAPHLAAVCAAGGVRPLHERGWYLVARAELVREVLRDPDRFSSRVHKHSPPPAEVADEVAAIRAQGWPYAPALGTADAPDHSRHRQLVNQLFTPRALAGMRPLVEQTADELAGALPDGAVVDFVAAFARPLPIWAICRIVGLPQALRGDVQRWTDAATASIGRRPDAHRWVQLETDLLQLQRSLAAALADGAAAPGTVLARLAAARDEPDGVEPPPTTSVLLTLLRELVVAGNETTARLLAEIVRLLADRPEEWTRVRTEPGRAEAIAEEALRWASPTQSALRRVTADTELGGVELPAGATLVVSFAAANRDPDAWAAADAFDPDRSDARRHLAFGLGPHVCVGAALARLELTTAIATLARHVDRLEVHDAEPFYTRSWMIRGLQELPVMVRRRAPVGSDQK